VSNDQVTDVVTDPIAQPVALLGLDDSDAGFTASNSTVRRLAAVILVVTAVKCLLAWLFPLMGDEVFLALQAGCLRLGYYDHPPAVMWILHGLLSLGHSPLLLRLPTIAVTNAIGIILYLLVRPYDKHKAYLASVLFLVCPMDTAFFMISTETPLMLASFSSVALLFLAEKKGRYMYYALSGLCLGLAFLFVEIPLIQRFILFLGHPAYAVSAVLFTLLLFSGMGSRLSGRLPPRAALALLALLLAGLPFLLPLLFDLTLGLPLAPRLGLAVLALAPAGFLMGVPFPAGICWLGDAPPGRIPWVWAVNGSASVIASVLAALLALSFGFTWVFWLGALCYGAAWLVLVITRPA
jgi:hypothetical protein